MNEYRNIEAMRQIIDLFFAGLIDNDAMVIETARLHNEVRK